MRAARIVSTTVLSAERVALSLYGAVLTLGILAGSDETASDVPSVLVGLAGTTAGTMLTKLFEAAIRHEAAGGRRLSTRDYRHMLTRMLPILVMPCLATLVLAVMAAGAIGVRAGYEIAGWSSVAFMFAVGLTSQLLVGQPARIAARSALVWTAFGTLVNFVRIWVV